MNGPNLEERQAELRADILAKRKNAKLKANAKRAKRNYWLRKSKPFREIRAAWAEKRRLVAERKAARLERKRIKEDAKLLREKTRKRKLKEPIAESARIFKEAWDAGRRFQAAEDAARFKTPITVV